MVMGALAFSSIQAFAWSKLAPTRMSPFLPRRLISWSGLTTSFCSVSHS
jgi:hypothetical protein